MIRLQDLEVKAGGFRLGIKELTVARGEYLTILGPTGAGKTVLLEAMAGLRRPTAGHIWFGEQEVTRDPPERRRVGIVYQDYALFPHLNVWGNIAFGLSRRADADRVQQLASLLKIEELLARSTRGLSGGEQQRVAIARALAVEPPILLLDEPLSALDDETRRDLRSEIRTLHRRLGVTVMHVTHDLDEALSLGDRVMVLVDGAVRQLDTPDEVLLRPADGRVARLLGSANVLPCRRVDGTEGGGARGGESGAAVTSLRLEEGPEILAGGNLSAAALDVPLVAVVRPEEISLVPVPTTLEKGEAPASALRANWLEGVVRDITHGSVSVTLEVEVPPMFTARLLRSVAQARRWEVGDRLVLCFPPSAVHVCPAA